MFLVQFLTPSPGMDPEQRKMMAIMMPVIFGFSMLHFASGLALYWGTGNIINLAIQLGINNPDGQGDARHRRQTRPEKIRRQPKNHSGAAVETGNREKGIGNRCR